MCNIRIVKSSEKSFWDDDYYEKIYQLGCETWGPSQMPDSETMKKWQKNMLDDRNSIIALVLDSHILGFAIVTPIIDDSGFNDKYGAVNYAKISVPDFHQGEVGLRCNLFFHSMFVLKGFRNTGYSAGLLSEVFNELKKWAGIDLMSFVVEDEGRIFVETLNMKKVKGTKHWYSLPIDKVI